jgi:hypothetical protein
MGTRTRNGWLGLTPEATNRCEFPAPMDCAHRLAGAATENSVWRVRKYV